MAKPNSPINFSGTFRDITMVRSRAYGDHYRKARTAYNLNEKMEESTALLKDANVYAKVFKDAIDSYRRGFWWGQLWQRLVSLFKVQLREKGSNDFSVLEGEDLNKIHRLSRIVSASTMVQQSGQMLTVITTSKFKRDPTRGKADGYEQTLIIFFVDNDLHVQSYSASTFFSLQAGGGEQRADFVIPDHARTAIIVMKCNFSVQRRPMNFATGMGMRVEKVVEIG